MKKLLFVLLTLASPTFLALAQTLSNYQATVNSQSPNFHFTFDGGSSSSCLEVEADTQQDVLKSDQLFQWRP